jgi:hypothetical protein
MLKNTDSESVFIFFFNTNLLGRNDKSLNHLCLLFLNTIYMSLSNEQKSGFILSCFILTEGAFVLINVYFNGMKFVHYLGFGTDRNGTTTGWIMAFVVISIYVYKSTAFPSVRNHMFQFSFLKLLALLVAVFASILEEVMIRKWIMYFLFHEGFGRIIQVATSGFCFGMIHGIWGLFGSKRAAIGLP